ncbi:uncharacterized protein LOC131957938 [Physella acuta]|uniref:uncharacterized protein LOC131957938 n=1 Tax=Physella acuta TaxID=109671 RepID=UPI0027DC130A|nr:uncharacterized protein LOC131957938 [Physella acuta]
MARSLLYTCLLLASFSITKTKGEIVSSCFGVNKTINFDCGVGNMVHITRTFYGFNPNGQCRLIEGEAGVECTLDEHAEYSCVGQQSCSINLPSGQWGVSIAACGQRSNYFQVEYTCVPVSSVTNICNQQKLTAQSGYIMTPRYPSKYIDQKECSTTILVHPSQKLNLHIIEMDLEPRGRTDCADLLYFNDKLRSITLCGQRTNNSYSMHSNFLTIQLQSSSGGLSKGFWLYYEAVPPLPTSLTPPPVAQQKVTAADETQNDSSDVKVGEPKQINESGQQSLFMTTLKTQSRTTVPMYSVSKNSGKQLPFAAIAGGVIGTLSLILVLLLLLLFIKWCKERKYNKAEKILEIRNPAFRSSNDFHENQSNNGYYC